MTWFDFLSSEMCFSLSLFLFSLCSPGTEGLYCAKVCSDSFGACALLTPCPPRFSIPAPTSSFKAQRDVIATLPYCLNFPHTLQSFFCLSPSQRLNSDLSLLLNPGPQFHWSSFSRFRPILTVQCLAVVGRRGGFEGRVAAGLVKTPGNFFFLFFFFF